MRPPSARPPGRKTPTGAGLKEEIDRFHRNQRNLSKGHIGKEDSEPLKFSKHMAKWRSGWIDQKTGEWREVWREPNGKRGGRFAKKPLPGERARYLGLN